MEARCENGVVRLSNFVLPSSLHELRVEKWTEGPKGKKKEVRFEKAFVRPGWKGEDWWTT